MGRERLALALLGLCLAVASPGARAADPQVEARAVLQQYFAAVRAGDWGKVWGLISEASRDGQSLEAFRTSRESGMGADLGRAIQTRTTYEIRGVRVAPDGERARADVAIRMPDLRAAASGGLPSPEQVAAAPLHDVARTLELVREGGAWKVVRPRARLSPQQLERLHEATRDSLERPRETPPGPAKP